MATGHERVGFATEGVIVGETNFAQKFSGAADSHSRAESKEEQRHEL